MKKLLCIILLFCLCEIGHGQKEDYQWIFNWSNVDSCDLNSVLGEKCGASLLDFNTLPPSFYRNEKITLDMSACNASICDENGNLLFYSNGQSIYGSKHIPIINGDTINYSPKWEWLTWDNENGETRPSGLRYAQAVGLFQVPNQDSLFYALYTNYEDNDQGRYALWQSVISKNANNEFEISTRDTVVNNQLGVPGNMHSCTHANGRDQWVLQFNKDSVFSYLISPLGLTLEGIQTLPFELRDTNGQSKFSSLGNKFALHGFFEFQEVDGSDLMISGFDRCTGKLITPQYSKISSFDSAGINTGLEFSPDGNLLYISYGTSIVQYDLSVMDIFSSGMTISNYEEFECELGFVPIFFGQLNLGVDNKIYIGSGAQCFEVHRIENPNERGFDCNLVQNAIKLPTYHFGTIPNVNTPRLGPLDGSPCDTLDIDNNPISKFWYEQDSTNHQEIQFRDVSYYRPEEWSWTFGDGNSSDEMSPLHDYDSNGVYEVCLTVSNENSSNTSCQELQIGPVANQNIQREYDINIFPNPVEDVTRLVFHDYLPERAQIILYDASGKKVFSVRVYQECIIDLSVLNAGAYLYEILDGDRFLTGGTIVKM